jgi:hypothetical protein
MSKTTTDSSNTSITFGSTQISLNELPKKKKFFNFKFVEPDTSYETQESSEESQFQREEEAARRAEEDSETQIKTEYQKDEETEETISSMPSLDTSLDLDTNTDTEIDTSMIVDIEPDTEIDDSDYQEAVNLFDFEKPDLPDLPEIPYLEVEPEEQEPTPLPTMLSIPAEPEIPDPDAGLTWYQKWKRQVFLERKEAGVDINADSIEDSGLASARDKANSYTQFKNRKDDRNINGIDTLIGFLTILLDNIGEILSSVLFFSKASIKYKKGDKTWNTGIGRIFTICLLGIFVYIFIKLTS